ncbi:MAG: hypothetical protein J3K34DRAFT_236353 [Monoraphidium minutum]|nr:MAG: hypothetical protein J3K34DRAFT_236353 [Monoraphidium minutum]
MPHPGAVQPSMFYMRGGGALRATALLSAFAAPPPWRGGRRAPSAPACKCKGGLPVTRSAAGWPQCARTDLSLRITFVCCWGPCTRAESSADSRRPWRTLGHSIVPSCGACTAAVRLHCRPPRPSHHLPLPPSPRLPQSKRLSRHVKNYQTCAANKR